MRPGRWEMMFFTEHTCICQVIILAVPTVASLQDLKQTEIGTLVVAVFHGGSNHAMWHHLFRKGTIFFISAFENQARDLSRYYLTKVVNKAVDPSP